MKKRSMLSWTKEMAVFAAISLGSVLNLSAQEDVPREVDHSMNGVRTTHFPEFKKLVFTPIPGGNILSQPERIDGTKFEIRTEKHGLIYPALYDWNKDGKKDLLLGEFETGDEESNIKVYLNTGTAEKPEYTGEWFYATDINGDTLTCHQWCCIGTHPQVVDIDGDGYDDIISGQYNPGLISWWRGSEKGFLPRQFIEQEYYEEGTTIENGVAGYRGIMSWAPNSFNYWNFTTARFADFNGDGLLDLFVAGSGGFRVALNKGTKEHPVLGLREYLFHVDGTILHIRRDPAAVVKPGENFDVTSVCGGDGHTYIFPYDWDHDGVLDLLVHGGYYESGSEAVYFFRGVNTDDGLRFEEAVPLFTLEDGSKALPGCAPMITIDDYNNDGVEDILLGLSIATFNPEEGVCEGGYEAVDTVNWSWLQKLGLNFPGKDAGASLKYYHNSIDTINKLMKEQDFFKDFMIGKLDDMRYVTLRHRGYPFVMYGSKNPVRAEAKTVKAAPKEFQIDESLLLITYQEFVEKYGEDALALKERQPEVSKWHPVDYVVYAPVNLYGRSDEFTVEVKFKTLADYHVYNHSQVNADQIPVEITFDYPENVMEKVGDLQEPKTAKGIREVYVGQKDADGNEVFSFKQTFRVKEGTTFEKAKIKVKVVYQTCSSQTCLPPVEGEQEVEVVF